MTIEAGREARASGRFTDCLRLLSGCDEGSREHFPVPADVFDADGIGKPSGQSTTRPSRTSPGLMTRFWPSASSPDLPPSDVSSAFLKPSLDPWRQLVRRRRGTFQQQLEVIDRQRDGPQCRLIVSGESNEKRLQGGLGRGIGQLDARFRRRSIRRDPGRRRSRLRGAIRARQPPGPARPKGGT